MEAKKIKLVFLIFAGLIVLSFATFSVAEENSASNKNIFQDSDQDGLSNEEEKAYGTDPNNSDTDGDSYSDGVEVRSGYNPLKPSPGDKIIAEKNPEEEKVAGVSAENNPESDKNLTQELSQKVSRLISENEVENEAITVEDLDMLISEAIAEELSFDDLPEIDEKSIKIKKQNYAKLSEEERIVKEKEDALLYFSAVSYIMMTNSPYKISNEEDIAKISQELISQMQKFSSTFDDSYFKDLADKGENILKQMSDLEVPESLADTHIKGIKLANYSISLKDEAKIDTQDPILSIINLSKAKNLIILANQFTQEAEEKLEKIGILELPLGLEKNE